MEWEQRAAPPGLQVTRTDPDSLFGVPGVELQLGMSSFLSRKSGAQE